MEKLKYELIRVRTEKIKSGEIEWIRADIYLADIEFLKSIIDKIAVYDDIQNNPKKCKYILIPKEKE